jgi:hypothetical protein
MKILRIPVAYELKSKGYSNNRYSFLFTLFLFQLRLSSRISRYLSGYLKNPKSLAKISDSLLVMTLDRDLRNR